MRLSVFGISTLVAALVGAAAAGSVQVGHDIEGDYYVILATEHSQPEAQERASEAGGWVLDTDIYPSLSPGLYAVVMGPFSTESDAQRKLAGLRMVSNRFEAAYVKHAGISRLPSNLGGPAVTPAILALLIGEIHVEIIDKPHGGESGCEPWEPHQQVRMTYWRGKRVDDAERESGAGLFSEFELSWNFIWIDDRGEIHVDRGCVE